MPSLLAQVRTRLGVERFRRVFTEILRQGREQGRVKERLGWKEATHLLANLALPSLPVPPVSLAGRRGSHQTPRGAAP